MVAYTTGIVIAPIRAQNPRMPTYGTYSLAHSLWTKESTYIVDCVAISNRVKSEISLESNHVSSESIHHLRQRRVNIKVIFPSNILSCKSSKVNFIKDDLIRFRDLVESDNTSDNGQCKSCCP
jgi:hypothetical protein